MRAIGAGERWTKNNANRLVTIFERDAKEARHQATILEFEPPAEIVRIHKRRMWIEATFRDPKNRDWGLGLDQVRLSESDRHQRRFIGLALAYAFLCAFGAAAETPWIVRMLQIDTLQQRVISLTRIGNHSTQISRYTLDTAFGAVAALPTQNWGAVSTTTRAASPACRGKTKSATKPIWVALNIRRKATG